MGEGEGEVLVDAALEHFEVFLGRWRRCFGCSGEGFLDVADVTGLEVHGVGGAAGGEDCYAAFACHEALPFLGVLVPVEFA